MPTLAIEFEAEKRPEVSGFTWWLFLKKLVGEEGITKQENNRDSNGDKTKIELTVQTDDESTLDEDGLWNLIVANIDGFLEVERVQA